MTIYFNKDKEEHAWNESVSAMADGYSTNVPKLPEAP